MNEAVREMWKAALTSGEYEQGIGALRTDDKFCCLGVLCDLYIKTTGNGRWSEFGLFTDETGFSSTGFPTENVRKWAGLRNNAPIAEELGEYLHVMNDQGKTFAEIAKAIDEVP